MNVLIVEDSQTLSQLLADGLAARDYDGVQARSLTAAKKALDERWPDAVILDAMFPADSGAPDFNAPEVLNLLDAPREEPRPLVILISGDERAAAKFATIRDWWFTGRIAGIVSKNEGGGWELFKEIVIHYLELHRSEHTATDDGSGDEDRLWLLRNDIISADPAMFRLARDIRRCVAMTQNDHPILIVGANGTGKTLVARAVWNEMKRKRGGADLPFLQLHAGEIQTTTMRSELFGSVKGSFTGAETSLGLFQTAGEGVLFLDDIQYLPPEARAAMLRAFQERSFRQLGGKTESKLRARLVTSTNVDLEKLHGEGGLPDEFYNRINGTALYMPPLAQRPGDIAAIVKGLVARGPSPRVFRPDALRALQNYPWPGNVRQLERLIERIRIFHQSDTVTLASMRALNLDYLGKQIEWLPAKPAPFDQDSLLERLGWHQGWSALEPGHESQILAWLKDLLGATAGIDFLEHSLRDRTAPRAIHYYKALLFAAIREGEIPHQAFQGVLDLGWDFTNRVLSYLAGQRVGTTDGLPEGFLARKNVRGKYFYFLR